MEIGGWGDGADVITRLQLNDFPKGSWTSVLNDEPPMVQYTWSLFKMLYQLIGGEEMLVSGTELSSIFFGPSSVRMYLSYLILYL